MNNDDPNRRNAMPISCAPMPRTLTETPEPAQEPTPSLEPRLMKTIAALGGIGEEDAVRLVKSTFAFLGIRCDVVLHPKRPYAPTPREPFSKSPT